MAVGALVLRPRVRVSEHARTYPFFPEFAIQNFGIAFRTLNHAV